MKPKTHTQLKRIFGLGNKLGCGKDDLEDLAYEVTNGRTEHLSSLAFDEANALIKRLGGDPLSDRLSQTRTARHRRQQAGVPQIATANQIRFLHDLAAGRGMTEDGLERLCRRMIKRARPRTTGECSKIIEAIKAMNKRESPAASPAASAGKAARKTRGAAA